MRNCPVKCSSEIFGLNYFIFFALWNEWCYKAYVEINEALYQRLHSINILYSDSNLLFVSLIEKELGLSRVSIKHPVAIKNLTFCKM